MNILYCKCDGLQICRITVIIILNNLIMFLISFVQKLDYVVSTSTASMRNAEYFFVSLSLQGEKKN